MPLSRILSLIILAAMVTAGVIGQTLRWYKGNTHTHTLNSDGESSPEDVVKWYRDSGYNFVFITDHEFITPVAPLNEKFAKDGSFLVIQGQEITDRLNKKPYHVSALNISTVVMPQNGATVVDNLQKNIDLVRTGGGVPIINHPNFGWALTADDIKPVKNILLMEIANAHPLVNNLGGGGMPSIENIWDALLTSGRLIYGIGSDDAHHFTKPGDKAAATPGNAWIVVRAESLSAQVLLAAIEKGDFYASTGVELTDYQTDGRTISISINEAKWSKYTVQFIGREGKVLKTVFTNPAVYKMGKKDGYVRAKIIESNGKMAWTQPVNYRKK